LDKKYLPVIAAILIAAFFLANVAVDIAIYYEKKTIINIFWAILFTGLAIPFIIFLLYVLEGYLYKRKIKESIKTVNPKKEKPETKKRLVAFG
jgi:hypothetical protein